MDTEQDAMGRSRGAVLRDLSSYRPYDTAQTAQTAIYLPALMKIDFIPN